MINKTKNKRFRDNLKKFKNKYNNPAEIPVDTNMYPNILDIILNYKVKTNEGIHTLYNNLNYYIPRDTPKKIKTKYKRTGYRDYDFKEPFYMKMSYNSKYKEREPKWGYIHSYFCTSHTNRERKRRYYIDGQDKLFMKSKIQHRFFLRYNKKDHINHP